MHQILQGFWDITWWCNFTQMTSSHINSKHLHRNLKIQNGPISTQKRLLKWQLLSVTLHTQCRATVLKVSYNCEGNDSECFKPNLHNSQIKFQKLCLEFLIVSPSTNSAQFSHNYFSHQTEGFNPWPDSEPD